MGGNVDEMRKPELMKYAASLGVATRRQGTKTWRLLKDVRADCKMREAAEQQRLLADAGGPGSANPSQAAGIGTRYLENMKHQDLRKARKRDLRGQRMFAQFFASVSLRQALLARAPITGAAASGAGSAIQAALDAASGRQWAPSSASATGAAASTGAAAGSFQKID